MIRGLLLLLLLLSGTMSHAQRYAEFYDSSEQSIQQFDRELIKQRSAESDFQYEQEEIEEPNILERFIHWLVSKLFRNLKPQDSDLIYTWVKWILGILGLIILVYYLRKLKSSRLFKREDLNLNQVQFLDFEGSEHDLDAAWRQAEEDQNHALAMRLLFIKCLHHLREKETIVWKKEKTNGDYLKELEHKWEHTPLSRLAKQFAYSQYGGYSITLSEYQEAKRLYIDVLTGKKGGSDEG